MGQNFIAADRDQVLLMPPALVDWLPDEHFVWTVLGAVEQMDLAEFYGAYRANGQGRAAYDPQVLSLLLYAYATGVSSSRQIERCCEVDVAFKVIAAMRVPDHSTIAEFRRRHQDAIAEVFVQVLALCAEAGLVRVGVIAIDGTKIAANASRDGNRSYVSIVEGCSPTLSRPTVTRTSVTARVAVMSQRPGCAPAMSAARRWPRPRRALRPSAKSSWPAGRRARLRPGSNWMSSSSTSSRRASQLAARSVTSTRSAPRTAG
jgi:transposase